MAGIRVQVDEVGAVGVGRGSGGSDGRGRGEEDVDAGHAGEAGRVAVAGGAGAARHLGEPVHVGPEGQVDGAVGVHGVGVAGRARGRVVLRRPSRG